MFSSMENLRLYWRLDSAASRAAEYAAKDFILSEQGGVRRWGRDGRLTDEMVHFATLWAEGMKAALSA